MHSHSPKKLTHYHWAQQPPSPIQNFNTNQPCIHHIAERLHPKVPWIPKKCWMQHTLNCRGDTPLSDTIKGLYNIVIYLVYTHIPLWKSSGFQNGESGFKEFSSSSHKAHTSLLGFRVTTAELDDMGRTKRLRPGTGWKHHCPRSATIYGSNIGLGKNSLWPHHLTCSQILTLDKPQPYTGRKLQSQHTLKK